MSSSMTVLEVTCLLSVLFVGWTSERVFSSKTALALLTVSSETFGRAQPNQVKLERGFRNSVFVCVCDNLATSIIIISIFVTFSAMLWL